MSTGDLSSKLKDRINQDREQFETIARSEFENFQKSLSASLQSALHTTESDINAQLDSMNTTLTNSLLQLQSKNNTFHKAFARTLARSTTLGLYLVLGSALGAWLLTMTTTRYTLELQKEITKLQKQQTTAQQTLAALEQKTWGVQLLDTKEGRFIILPKTTTAKTGWTVGTKKALKLEQE